jgi:hypothetical protein
MKSFVLILTIAILACCNEEEGPKTYDSIEGKWKYTTPDKEMEVEFEIAQVANEYQLKNVVMFINNQKQSINMKSSNIDVDSQYEIIHSISLYAEIYGVILFQSVLRNEFYTELTAGQVDYSVIPGETINLEFQVIKR